MSDCPMFPRRVSICEVDSLIVIVIRDSMRGDADCRDRCKNCKNIQNVKRVKKKENKKEDAVKKQKQNKSTTRVIVSASSAGMRSMRRSV